MSVLSLSSSLPTRSRIVWCARARLARAPSSRASACTSGPLSSARAAAEDESVLRGAGERWNRPSLAARPAARRRERRARAPAPRQDPASSTSTIFPVSARGEAHARRRLHQPGLLRVAGGGVPLDGGEADRLLEQRHGAAGEVLVVVAPRLARAARRSTRSPRAARARPEAEAPSRRPFA